MWFFVQCFNNLFSVKIINKICPRHSIFKCFNYKNFLRPIWSVTLEKTFSYFDILTISPILNLGYLSLNFLLESVYVLDFTLTGFILIVLCYVLLYLFTISSNLSIYTFFETEGTYLKISFFKVLMNLLAVTYFPSLRIEYISRYYSEKTT